MYSRIAAAAALVTLSASVPAAAQTFELGGGATVLRNFSPHYHDAEGVGATALWPLPAENLSLGVAADFTLTPHDPIGWEREFQSKDGQVIYLYDTATHTRTKTRLYDTGVYRSAGGGHSSYLSLSARARWTPLGTKSLIYPYIIADLGVASVFRTTHTVVAESRSNIVPEVARDTTTVGAHATATLSGAPGAGLAISLNETVGAFLEARYVFILNSARGLIPIRAGVRFTL